MKKLTKKQFYILSFTWGLPLSLLGVLTCCILMCFGYKTQKFGHCYYIAIGKHWGGLEMGWFFLCSNPESEFIKKHELGHGYQNACQYGWFMPILSIISAIRYWMNHFGARLDYYSWWFERRANEIGAAVMDSEE